MFLASYKKKCMKTLHPLLCWHQIVTARNYSEKKLVNGAKGAIIKMDLFAPIHTYKTTHYFVSPRMWEKK